MLQNGGSVSNMSNFTNFTGPMTKMILAEVEFI
jgi:hypothetical protein